MAADALGRLPLHMVCESYLSSRKLFRLTQSQLNHDTDHPVAALERVIQLLLETCPTCIFAEDDEGMCAIEYAIEVGLPISTVTLLQRTSEKERKKLDKIRYF